MRILFLLTVLITTLVSAQETPYYSFQGDLYDEESFREKLKNIEEIYSNQDGYKYTTVNYKVRTTKIKGCLLYTSPSPRDGLLSRMPSSA